ncbi:hypothetical protein K443DRAFT_632564 [Laccaria amethystina LaAM-08-1]|uniref:Unplaced genomic scaffold K443scaffold_166, whole genome shotgun sequence n=1 Tax=Laccaria amethystina LaAM-08-1 TaxID=1095629 RepID=A0A0C9XLT8_9AGAR|nr:hypothetical protein K443DRAFT_632564 [Laccaria amethystina LaAM-08-1]
MLSHRPPADERHSLFPGRPRKDKRITTTHIRASDFLSICMVVMKGVETSVLLTSCLRVLVSVSGFGDMTVLDNLEPPHYQR